MTQLKVLFLLIFGVWIPARVEGNNGNGSVSALTKEFSERKSVFSDCIEASHWEWASNKHSTVCSKCIRPFLGLREALNEFKSVSAIDLHRNTSYARGEFLEAQMSWLKLDCRIADMENEETHSKFCAETKREFAYKKSALDECLKTNCSMTDAGACCQCNENYVELHRTFNDLTSMLGDVSCSNVTTERNQIADIQKSWSKSKCSLSDMLLYNEYAKVCGAAKREFVREISWFEQCMKMDYASSGANPCHKCDESYQDSNQWFQQLSFMVSGKMCMDLSHERNRIEQGEKLWLNSRCAHPPHAAGRNGTDAERSQVCLSKKRGFAQKKSAFDTCMRANYFGTSSDACTQCFQDYRALYQSSNALSSLLSNGTCSDISFERRNIVEAEVLWSRYSCKRTDSRNERMYSKFSKALKQQFADEMSKFEQCIKIGYGGVHMDPCVYCDKHYGDVNEWFNLLEWITKHVYFSDISGERSKFDGAEKLWQKIECSYSHAEYKFCDAVKEEFAEKKSTFEACMNIDYLRTDTDVCSQCKQYYEKVHQSFDKLQSLLEEKICPNITDVSDALKEVRKQWLGSGCSSTDPDGVYREPYSWCNAVKHDFAIGLSELETCMDMDYFRNNTEACYQCRIFKQKVIFLSADLSQKEISAGFKIRYDYDGAGFQIPYDENKKAEIDRSWSEPQCPTPDNSHVYRRLCAATKQKHADALSEYQKCDRMRGSCNDSETDVKCNMWITKHVQSEIELRWLVEHQICSSVLILQDPNEGESFGYFSCSPPLPVADDDFSVEDDDADGLLAAMADFSNTIGICEIILIVIGAILIIMIAASNIRGESVEFKRLTTG